MTGVQTCALPIFGLADGRVNIGLGILNTSRAFQNVDYRDHLRRWLRETPEHWQLRGHADTVRIGGMALPMWFNRQPHYTKGMLLVGDAGGMVNPFNGEGIDYAYETGRMVADLLDESLRTGSGMPLQRYPHLLEEEYGLYFKVARLFAKVIGQPVLMRELTRVGIRSRSLMDWVLRIMANLLQPDEIGPAEAAYKAAAAIVKRVPDPLP